MSRRYQDCALTKDEEHFHSDVRDDGAPGLCVGFNIRCEADVIRHRHGHVERRQQDHPIPQCLAHTVVEKDEARFLHRRDFVLGQRRLLKHVLLANKEKTPLDHVTILIGVPQGTFWRFLQRTEQRHSTLFCCLLWWIFKSFPVKRDSFKYKADVFWWIFRLKS